MNHYKKIIAVVVSYWIIVIAYILLAEPFGYSIRGSEWDSVFQWLLIPPAAFIAVIFVLKIGFSNKPARPSINANIQNELSLLMNAYELYSNSLFVIVEKFGLATHETARNHLKWFSFVAILCSHSFWYGQDDKDKNKAMQEFIGHFLKDDEMKSAGDPNIYFAKKTLPIKEFIMSDMKKIENLINRGESYAKLKDMNIWEDSWQEYSLHIVDYQKSKTLMTAMEYERKSKELYKEFKEIMGAIRAHWFVVSGGAEGMLANSFSKAWNNVMEDK